MATDPAVQAAAEAIHAATHTHSHLDCFGATDSDRHNAELVVLAVTPLIRAQAFTEAAKAITQDASDWRRHQRIAEHLAALVRGLGEKDNPLLPSTDGS